MKKIGAATIVLCCVALLAGGQATSRPAIVLGKDTTRIVTPLKANGTPDYVAAMNDTHSKGVTAQNNAIIPLIEALGPESFNEAVRERALKRIQMESPKGPFLDTKFSDQTEFDACLKLAILKAGEHAELAAWLKANTKPLDLVVEASKRPRWYSPAILKKDGDSIASMPLPSLTKVLSAARMLLLRAKFAAAEGRMEDSRQNLLAVMRLGALLDQDATLVTHLVGVAISLMADEACAKVAGSGKLDGKTARAMLAEVQAAAGPPSVVSAIDEGERFMALDTICHLSAVPPKEFAKQWNEMGRSALDITGNKTEEAKPTPQQVEGFRRLSEQTDWNAILRKANIYFDHMAAAMEGRLGYVWDAGKERPIPSGELPQSGTPEFASFLGNAILYVLLPALERAQVVHREACERRDLTMLALALAIFKADKGSYPKNLVELEPAYVKKVPKDLFGGNDLIYRLGDDGYLLYSIGSDLKDDGGKSQGATKPDIVVRGENNQ
jgi:hypothetical protein